MKAAGEITYRRATIGLTADFSVLAKSLVVPLNVTLNNPIIHQFHSYIYIPRKNENVSPQKNLCTNVRGRIIDNSQKVELTQVSIIDEWIIKVYVHTMAF